MMIAEELEQVINQWLAINSPQKDEIVVIGCSTSEVAGQPIGTSGSTDIAKSLYEQMTKFQKQTGVHLAFQCCEHLNRALVVDWQTAVQYKLEEVTAVPVPEAGGSMASYAYRQMEHPVVVESIQAHAGMDIGETMIGMHLKSVPVPLKLEQRTIGHARVRAARTRPKLIGGQRAFYGENTGR
ncbi:TIGR01440 family protein [Oceanobacillus locisalsi]|uniref:UPF0340 protein ACFQ19_00560 n=1 Tax=Oceanobacillus locisalsi TaxID=546107 RepID=A0ABW3NAN0_9BACI